MKLLGLRLVVVMCNTVYASNECDIYLAPSTVPGAGRGLFAGRDFKTNEVIDRCPSLSFQQIPIESTQLNNYVYGTEHDSYALASFGTAMVSQEPQNNIISSFIYALLDHVHFLKIYNHRQSPNVHHYYVSSEPPDPR